MVKTALKKKKKYADIYDKLGFRLVTHFKSEISLIKKFIESNFSVINFESKSQNLKYNQLGYVSEHYEVKINSAVSYFKEYKKYEDIIFEIQVRTICQHAWADVEHALAYKQEIDLDDTTKRKIFRLTSLLEICDDEFDNINSELLKNPEFIIFYFMKKIEGKFYKYAKMRYDRDLSFENISNLKELFSADVEINSVINNIIEFVEQNEARIKLIFSERQEELNNNIFLSQPEILLIWYFIEAKEYELIRIWSQNYDINDLSEISIWWGKPIAINQ